MPDWKAISCTGAVYDRFEDRRPEHMTQSEYLDWLLDRRDEDPDIADTVADRVAARLSDEVGVDLGPVRDAARSGAAQALREVE